MKSTFIMAAIGATLTCMPAANAMSDAECTAAWIKADVKSIGAVAEQEARQYFAILHVAGKPVADGMPLKEAAFLEHFKACLFNVVLIDPAAPLSGAKRFTESQAKDRVIAAGFADVSALVKDDQGI